MIDPGLNKLLNGAIEAKTSENHIVSWDNHRFEMVVQDNLGVIYLLDITRYAKIEDKYKAERLAIGQVFIDNYDELSEAMHDLGIWLNKEEAAVAVVVRLTTLQLTTSTTLTTKTLIDHPISNSVAQTGFTNSICHNECHGN